MSTNNDDCKLSEDEIALYDRQIRLWGMAAQARMRSARVLLINLGSIGTEICKNIVLSGFGSLSILDSHKVTEEDLSSQFFVGSSDVGTSRLEAAKTRIQDMNPRVQITFDTEEFKNKPSKFFSSFNLVIGTQMNKQEMIHLNEITRRYNIPLYLAGSNGLFAYIFVDLIQFDAEDKKLKTARPTATGKVSPNTEVIDVKLQEDDEDANKVYEVITTRNYYKTFGAMLETASLEGKLNRRQMKRLSSAVPLTLALLSLQSAEQRNGLRDAVTSICKQLKVPQDIIDDNYVELFLRQADVEFSPVSAVIGGAVAQDVINILGKKQAPLNNFIVFDGITLDMPIFEI